MIIPHKFVAGTKAKAQEVNENFDAVNEEMSTLATSIQSGNATIMANINSQITGVEAQLEALKDYVYPIGSPKVVLNSALNADEIWLEGQEVSKETYAKLYAVYGNTYGTPKSTSNFVLPNFKNRVMWGATNFGYIEAGLPDHQHANLTAYRSGTEDGDLGKWITCDSDGYEQATFEGSYVGNVSNNPIYGRSSTVQPPSIKVRVKTRYK